MKRIVTLLCAVALGLMMLTGCNQQAAPSITVGVVDEAAAFQKNQLAAKAMAYLQEMGAPLQKEAEAAYKAMQADQNETTVAAYKKAMGELQAVMNGEQQRIVGLVDAKFNEVLEAYRVEKGLTLILSRESVISSAETVDITADIVAAMDKLEVDFAKPEAPAAPAAEEAKPETKE
ncbi:OmpH family outer membrane protein [Pseudodesulfovibrio sp. zrk46]|uniref:OmpH family outer membrane protein n=1 Tax=Pseudodesulfovibrio sp. zrk46 TaxID=2725288 RepID=UPI0014494794|nr:OmpH family outer membrane protein [Pseudodesulfovibrio sp. zrk46]QJB56207.1 OmpH family outer membrane protein [Pseudodesulfovibrio sp. zrk46]